MFWTAHRVEWIGRLSLILHGPLIILLRPFVIALFSSFGVIHRVCTLSLSFARDKLHWRLPNVQFFFLPSSIRDCLIMLAGIAGRRYVAWTRTSSNPYRQIGRYATGIGAHFLSQHIQCSRRSGQEQMRQEESPSARPLRALIVCPPLPLCPRWRSLLPKNVRGMATSTGSSGVVIASELEVGERAATVGNTLETEGEGRLTVLENILGDCLSYPNVLWAQDMLACVHQTTGLPWWLSISTTTLTARALLFPLAVYQAKIAAHLQEAAPKLAGMK